MRRKNSLLLVCLMVVVSLSIILISNVSGQEAIISNNYSGFKAYASSDISGDMLAGAVSNFEMDGWFAEKHLALSRSSKFSSGDMVRTTHNAVYMRSGPSTSYPHVRWLAKGAVAEVKYHWNNGTWADQHYWWYVQLEEDSQHGWIVETYLEAINGGTPEQPPGKPNLRSPRSGASDVPVRPTFQWDPVSGATKYALVVVADYLPDGIIIETSSTSHTLSASNSLREDELHMWSVMAGNNAGWGESADNRHFWTEKSEQTGAIRINIEPGEARSAGAQWRLTSGPDQGWKNSGATIRDLPTGSCTVNFKDIGGWERPSDISVRVSEGSTVTRTATYSADDKGPDCVISPPDAPSGPTRGEVGELYFFSIGGASCSDGHQVEYQFSGRLDGSNWEDSDFGFPTSFTLKFFEEGVHELRTRARCSVNHEVVSAWSPLHTIIIGEVEKAGSARVIIEPYGARSAGAQWRLTSGPDQDWKNSGAAIRDLPTGSYTVNFKDIGGWERPAELIIDVLAGETVTRYARYTEGIDSVQSVKLTADPVRQAAPFETIVFTAEATGGVNREYLFYYRTQPGGKMTPIGSWRSNNYLRAHANREGEYRIGVEVRSRGTSQYEARDEITYTIKEETVEPVTSVTLSANPSSPTEPGELVTLTAEATGGTDPEYSFGWRPKGSRSWIHARGYSSNNTFSAAPNQAGEYEVVVVARSAGSSSKYDAHKIIDHTISTAAVDPVTAVSLSASPPSPTRAGDLITLTAEATGGVDPEYSFEWRPKGTHTWTTVREYNNNNTISAAPNQAGEYEVRVLSRSAGSDAKYEALKKIDYEITEKKDSGEFKVGDIIKTTTSNLRVRDDKKIIIPSSLPKGIVGQVIGGPVDSEVEGQTHTFWKVNWRWNAYCEDISGWSAGDWLEKTPDHSNEVYWLARMIMSEASVGTEMERAAVGWTAINRSKINADRFGGNTIFGVVSKWAQYSLRQEPTAEIIRLANKILNGEISDPAKDAGLGPATHFFSPYSMMSTGYNYIVPNDGSIPSHLIGKRVPFPSWARPAAEISLNTREYVTSDNRKEWKQRTGIRNWYYMFYNSRIYKLTAYLNGPGELRIYDSQGRVTGVIDGEIFEEIYDSQYKDGSVVIEYPGDSYKYLVAGTKEGGYDLQIRLEGIEDDRLLKFKNIATAKDITHKYLIDWGIVIKDKEQADVTVKIDTDGDGNFEDLKVDYSLQ